MDDLLEDPTWEDMVAAEPGLARLLIEILDADAGDKNFCGVTAWYGRGGKEGFKMRLYWLAGFRAHNHQLRSHRAYEVAVERLFDALPRCRGCSCIADEAVIVTDGSEPRPHV
jgi:hypothetical protein